MSQHEIERRTILGEATVEYRDVDNGEKRPVIAGYAAVFNSESRDLGGFVETIHPAAFDDVLAKKPDVLGVFNHDRNLLLGRTGNGQMRLSVDSYGLRYEIMPGNTSVARDVVEWVKDRTVVGSSFAFAINRDGGDSWSTDPRGFRRREVRSIAMLEDCGPVARPAYEAASAVVSRRCIEMALGESHRPNQTMANAARRGLKLAERTSGVDQVLVGMAERIASRQIVSVEEVAYLSSVYERCMAAKAKGWNGSAAWVDWQLAGGDSGMKWVSRRAAHEPAEEARAIADIDFSPPEGVRNEAKRGLEWRQEHNRGGTEIGVARARDLSNGKNISPNTARRMKAYFDRHEVDKKGQGWAPGEDGFPSAGRIAWALWGGDPGRAWANKLVKQLNADEPRDLGDDIDAEVAVTPVASEIVGSAVAVEEPTVLDEPEAASAEPSIDYVGKIAALKATLLSTRLHGARPTR